MSYNKEWQRIVFSDEKEFNLENSDGLRKKERYLSRPHSYKASVIVQGAISYYGTCELQFLSARMNANNSKSVLKNVFSQFSILLGLISWIF